MTFSPHDAGFWRALSRTTETVVDGHEIKLHAFDDLACDEVQRITRYLAGRRDDERHLLEGRSVSLPATKMRRFNGIKVKGCGLLGGTIVFGRRHRFEYSVPRYDFEGCYAKDDSRDHHRAPEGGMSYQQAVNEAKIAYFLASRGFDTYPGLGFGSVRKGGMTSWFCLLDAPFAPAVSRQRIVTNVEEARVAATFDARTQLELASLGVYLTLLGAAMIDGRMARKDFHTARIASLDDSPATLLAYHLMDVRFALRWYEVQPFGFDRGTTAPARSAYVETLAGRAFSAHEIDRFWRLIYEIGFDTLHDLAWRARRLDADPIAQLIQRQHYERLGEESLLETWLETAPVAHLSPAIYLKRRVVRLAQRAMGRAGLILGALRRQLRVLFAAS